MIKEAIEKIQSLVNEAQRANIIHAPGDPAHLLTVLNTDGTVSKHEVAPGNREVTLETLDGLIAMALSHFDEKVKDEARLLVTYSAQRVVLTFDHQNGRERARVNLSPSVEFQFFNERCATPLIEVAALRQALRLDLRKTYDDAKLINQVSALAFSDTDHGGVVADRGRESLGRAINKQVQEPDKLPDPYQTFNVRKYINPDLDIRFPLQCVLDPDPKTRRWLLKPLEDSWIEFNAAVVQHVGDKLRAALKESGVPVYQGIFEQESAVGGEPYPVSLG